MCVCVCLPHCCCCALSCVSCKLSEDVCVCETKVLTQRYRAAALATHLLMCGCLTHTHVHAYFPLYMYMYTAPAHQFSALYRYGELDSCEGKLERWVDCLLASTSGPYAPKAMERETGRMRETTPPLWDLRNKDEAQCFWRAQYPSMFDDKGNMRGRDGGSE